MKTLFKTYDRHDQCRVKQIELETKTGVKWDWYRTGDGMRFCPIVTRDTPLSPDNAEKLLPYLTNEYQNFVALSEKSRLSLGVVISGAKTLIHRDDRRGVPTVNRNGRFGAIKRA